MRELVTVGWKSTHAVSNRSVIKKVSLRGWISLCRKPNFHCCIVFIHLFAQSVIVSSANFSWYKPQASGQYSPRSPWGPFNFGVMFATCYSSGTKALLSSR